MISILIPYRNRDLERIEVLFHSLEIQTNTLFTVYLIDYGSLPELARKVKLLCDKYSFIEYKYCHTRFQPWNKSRALNSVIKNLETAYCFVADVDIIFHPDFVETVFNCMENRQTTYFRVGYLSSEESRKDLQFHEYSIDRLSTHEATGLSLFPVKHLKELNGFDEFYHFWGAEDTDMHVRLKNAGYKVEFYDEKLLLLHQWHKSYQSLESSGLTSELQVTGILPLNHQHLRNTLHNGITRVNHEHWGETLSNEEYLQLEESGLFKQVTNEKRQVEAVLYGQLPGFKNGVLKIRFIQDPFENSLKYKVKRILGKKVPKYYTLKEVNDLVLLHLISFYRNLPYTIKVNNGKEIEVAIKF